MTNINSTQNSDSMFSGFDFFKKISNNRFVNGISQMVGGLCATALGVAGVAACVFGALSLSSQPSRDRTGDQALCFMAIVPGSFAIKGFYTMKEGFENLFNSVDRVSRDSFIGRDRV